MHKSYFKVIRCKRKQFRDEIDGTTAICVVVKSGGFCRVYPKQSALIFKNVFTSEPIATNHYFCQDTDFEAL